MKHNKFNEHHITIKLLRLVVCAMSSSSISSMHSASSSSLEAWSACQGALHFHESTRNFVSNASSAALLMVFTSNVACSVALIVVGLSWGTITGEEASTSSASCSWSDSWSSSGGVGRTAVISATEHFE